MGLPHYALVDFDAFGEVARLRGVAAVFFAWEACGLADEAAPDVWPREAPALEEEEEEEEEGADAGLLADTDSLFGSALVCALASTGSGSSTITCSTTTVTSV